MQATRTASAPAPGALIERAAELEAIRHSLDEALAGTGASIVLEGPAGIGKSALLEHAGELAAESGFRTLSARTDVLERDFPYGVIRQLYEPPLRDASRLQREQLLDGAARLAGDVLLRGSSPGRESPTLLAHSLYWLAAGLAEQRPLLLLVEDAHWADLSSARALLHLARRLGDVPIALLLAIRPGEPDAPTELTERLCAEPRTTTLTLEALSAVGSATLVRRALAAADDGLCARCHEAAAGNPLVVGELARIVATAGPAVLADDGSLRDDAHSPVLDRDVRRRLATLAPQARAAIEALATFGDGARPAQVAELAGLDVEAVFASRDALVAGGLLADGDDLRFPHAVIRQAAEASLPRGERARRHRRAAQLLARDGASLDAVAAHLLLCDPAGDGAAVATLRDAAERALEGGSPETATAYLRRALDEPPDPARAHSGARRAGANRVRRRDPGCPGAPAGRARRARGPRGPDRRPDSACDARGPPGGRPDRRAPVRGGDRGRRPRRRARPRDRARRAAGAADAPRPPARAPGARFRAATPVAAARPVRANRAGAPCLGCRGARRRAPRGGGRARRRGPGGRRPAAGEQPARRLPPRGTRAAGRRRLRRGARGAGSHGR